MRKTSQSLQTFCSLPLKFLEVLRHYTDMAKLNQPKALVTELRLCRDEVGDVSTDADCFVLMGGIFIGIHCDVLLGSGHGLLIKL